MNQQETAELYEELLAQNRGDRNQAFMYHGVACYNYNTIILHRQVVEQAIEDKQERIMAQVQKIIKMVEALAEDSVGIAMFAEELVEKQPKLAESLEFVLGVELQEKHRRENAD